MTGTYVAVVYGEETAFHLGSPTDHIMKKLRGILPVYALSVTLMGTLAGLFASCAGFSTASQASTEQPDLLSAAKLEIAFSNANGNKETACSTFVMKVLNRAGHSVSAFSANDFEAVAANNLPSWNSKSFRAEDSQNNQDELRGFLNSLSDGSIVIAQWPRINRSGHIAFIEKVSDDSFVIYQAQAGLSLPHKKSTTIESLLYIRNQWGDRSHMRIFYDF